MPWTLPLALLLLALAWTPAAHAQAFFAARPSPDLMVGPLLVRATVEPERTEVAVEILFTMAIPPTRSALDFEQDLYLLWPGAVRSDLAPGRPDVEMGRAVEAQGFDVVAEGRLPLASQRHYELATDAEPVPGGAPFVTVVRTGGPLGLSVPATLVRVPWTPRLANPAWVMGVRFHAPGLVKARPRTWVQRTFSGPRQSLALGFNDVSSPAMFAMYFWQRDRALPLAEPSRLVVEFAGADQVGIEAVSPGASRRELSQAAENTAVVSLYLHHTDGLTPQVLTVEFGYLSWLQSWGAVLIPILFFVLGNAAAPGIRVLAERLGRAFGSRVQLGPRRAAGPARERGVIVPRERLARIVPGQTTFEEVRRLCGEHTEEREGLDAPGRTVLVYQGHREVPHRRWSLGWVATIARWHVEDHEVEITLQDGVVRDVQARVRRTPLAGPA